MIGTPGTLPINVSIETIAWLAGILEGEGHFQIRKSGQPARICLSMTDKDIVDRVAALWGRKCWLSRRRKQEAHPNWKDAFDTRIAGDKAAAWAEVILPFMGNRRSIRIKEMIEAQRNYKRLAGGWTSHRARYGCSCQADTGSCQSKEAKC